MHVSRIVIAAAVSLALAGCASAGPGAGGAPSTSASDSSEAAPPSPSAATASPSASPSQSPSSASKQSAVTAIPAAEIAEVDVLDMTSGEPFAARWVDPGVELAIFVGGSGSANCVPSPTGVATSENGKVVVTFAWPSGKSDACTMDYMAYGWTIALDDAVDGTVPVEVAAEGLDLAANAEPSSVTLDPDQVLP